MRDLENKMLIDAYWDDEPEREQFESELITNDGIVIPDGFVSWAYRKNYAVQIEDITENFTCELIELLLDKFNEEK